MSEQTTLPEWARWHGAQIVVDVDHAYPKFLAELSLEPTQFSCAVVKICINRLLVMATGREGLVVRFVAAPETKAQWRDENLSAEQGSHDDGVRQAGKYLDRLLKARAAKALMAE